MKSGTSYWNLSFLVHSLLAFTAVVGLQHHLFYTIAKSITVVAVALPQTQAAVVVGASAALVESLQFNAFDTTRTTFASSSFRPSSHLSSSPSLEGVGATKEKISMPALPSSLSYPTSTTISGFHNTKTSRVMSNINSISPTQTINNLHTTYRSKSTSRSSRGSSRSSSSSSDISGKSLVNKMVGGKLQNGLSSDTPTASSGISSGVAFKNLKKSNIRGINSDSSGSGTGSASGQQQEQQNFPLDFTFSKNHWTNSDAALNGGGMDTELGGNVNFRLGSLSSVTSSSSASSSSSSISAFSSSLSASSLAATETERPRIFRNKHHHERHWGPFFEEPLNSTTSGDNSITTAHLFTEAVLNCRVGMLKDKTVMWVRRTSEKVSLLTVGNVTYSSDPRIRVKFQYPNNWRLLINPTQWDDAGIYMCQVSTYPPRVFTTNLTVIEPPLRLIDDQERDVGDRYYKTGSTIDLYCQVSRSFLYKEKQNILKSLKPLNIHNDRNTTTTAATTTTSTTTTTAATNSVNSSNSVTATNSSSNIFGTHNKTGVVSSENTFNPGYSNNSNNDQMKMSGSNKNNNKQPAGYAPNMNGISAFTATSSSSSSSSSFGVLNNDLFPSLKQSTTSADKQAIALEQQQFSNLVLWSKNDETLPATASKRSSSSDKWFISRVTITDAKLTDSGNYSCSIGRMYAVIVQVQVLTGELPAAVQHNSAATFVVLSESIRELIQFYWLYLTAACFLLK